jgi:hypothetical protein
LANPYKVRAIAVTNIKTDTKVMDCFLFNKHELLGHYF